MMRITATSGGGGARRAASAMTQSLPRHHLRVAALQAPARARPQLPLLRLCHSERVLRASLGVVGGGLLVTSALQWQRETLWRRSYDDEDDSWGGFIGSSVVSVKRAVEREFEDDNKKALAGLVAANTAVFALWRVPFGRQVLDRFMWRHFACSYTAVAHGKRVHTLLTSAFSHVTVPHFAVNMFMLWEFGRHILAPAKRQDAWYERAADKSRVVEYLRSSRDSSGASRLQVDKFMALYFGSAVASSALSVVVSGLRGTPGVFTIGASGAVMGVFTVYCLLFPERELLLFGLVNITAANALKLTTALNLVGSAFQRNLSIDCVGHIGGQTTGLVLNETSLLQ